MVTFLAAESQHSPVLPIWQEMIVGLIAFGAVVFVLGKYVWPRMEETFKARVEAIEGGSKRAEEAQREATDMLEHAREEADRIITAGRDSLAAERASIVRELRAEIGDLSVQLAERIVG